LEEGRGVCYFFFAVISQEAYAGFYANSITIKGKQKIWLWVSLIFLSNLSR